MQPIWRETLLFSLCPQCLLNNVNTSMPMDMSMLLSCQVTLHAAATECQSRPGQEVAACPLAGSASLLGATAHAHASGRAAELLMQVLALLLLEGHLRVLRLVVLFHALDRWRLLHADGALKLGMPCLASLHTHRSIGQGGVQCVAAGARPT
jgi:hypothetical protein